MTINDFKDAVKVDKILRKLTVSELESIYWDIDLELRNRDLQEKQLNYHTNPSFMRDDTTEL